MQESIITFNNISNSHAIDTDGLLPEILEANA